MNGSSLLSALFILAIALILAAVISIVSTGHWKKKKQIRVRRLIIGCGVVFALYTYFIDSSIRGVTLFEERIEWETGTEKSWTVEVENPGVEHKLRMTPLLPPFKEAVTPVKLQVLFQSTKGEAAVNELLEFPVVTESGRSGAMRDVWDEKVVDFVPPKEGVYQLNVSAESKPPPILFIRIEDPEKTDGVRTSGY